jgi:hypothetical protein
MAENAEFPRYWANDRCYFHGSHRDRRVCVSRLISVGFGNGFTESARYVGMLQPNAASASQVLWTAGRFIIWS